MNNINFKKIIIIIAYLYVFSMIYQSGSVMAALIRSGFLVSLTKIILLVTPVICALFFKIKKKYLMFLKVLIPFFILFVLINSFLYLEGVLSLIYKTILIMSSIYIYLFMSKNKVNIHNIIYNVIVLIASITIFFYYLVEIVRVTLPYKEVFFENSYHYRDYFGLFFTYHYSYEIPRLSGLFWEPGAYQIYLNIALFYYIFGNKNKKWQLFILILNIIFTQSTTGYCITCLLLAIGILRCKLFDYESKKKFFMIGLIFACIFIAYFMYKKILTTSVEMGSYSLRMGDIKNGLRIFINNPIIGVGFGNELPFIANDVFGRGSSNGLISYLYMTGFVGIVFALSPFIINIRKSVNKSARLLWLLLFLLFNACEPIYNLPIISFYIGVEYAATCERRCLYNMGVLV